MKTADPESGKDTKHTLNSQEPNTTMELENPEATEPQRNRKEPRATTCLPEATTSQTEGHNHELENRTIVQLLKELENLKQPILNNNLLLKITIGVNHSDQNDPSKLI